MDMKRWKVWLVMAALAVLLVGCSKQGVNGETASGQSVLTHTEETPSESREPVVMTTEVPEQSTETPGESGQGEVPGVAEIPEKEYTWSLRSEFTPDGIVPLETALFNMLAELPADQNLMVSPYSLEMVMTMLYHCSEGEARAQLEEFLGIEGTEEDVYTANAERRQALLKEREGVEILLADSFWVRAALSEQAKAVQAKLQEYYDCEVVPVTQFDTATLDQINGWVSDQTNGMIKKLFDQLSADTVTVLIDTLYFKGTWQMPFDAKDSTVGEFFGRDASESTSVQYMNMEKKELRYANHNGIQVVELPYGEDGEIVMDVFIGENGWDPAVLFRDNGARMEELFYHLGKADIGKLTLPKWKETYSINGLKEYFEMCGIADALGEESMSRIVGGTAVDQIVQKTAIEVSEKGTEASAASGVSNTESAPVPVDEFIVDHNFAYVIRSRWTKEILFMGVVNQLDHAAE